jgi:hypothetical protein
MFLVTPPLLYLLVAWRRWSAWQACLWAGAAPMALGLMLFIGTGYNQFGNRYLLEGLPLMLGLVAVGMNGRLSHVGYGLIVLAVCANLFGTYAFDPSLFGPVSDVCQRSTLVGVAALAVLGRVAFGIRESRTRTLAVASTRSAR